MRPSRLPTPSGSTPYSAGNTAITRISPAASNAAPAASAEPAPTSVTGRAGRSSNRTAVVSASAAGPCCHGLCDAIIHSGDPSIATSVADSATVARPRRRSTASRTTPVTAAIAALAFFAVQRA